MSDLFDQEDPSQSQALEALMQATGEDLRVGIPGIITKVESTDPPRVTVQPLIRRAEASAADPGIPGVPVAFPRSGGATVALPVAVGNPGWLKISDRELDGWIAGGGSKTVTAQNPRTHDLADCVFEPMDISALPTGAAGNAWFGGATVTSIVEGLAVKLGALAVEKVIKGTTFNAQHSIMLLLLSAAIASIGAASGSAGAAFTALGSEAMLTPPTQALCNTAGTALSGVTALCTAATAGITSFLGLASTWTSTKVSTE